MPIDRPLRVLTIGHSYVVALNRAVARKIGEDPAFDVTIAAPSFFQGDLRPMHLESEPDGSSIRVVPIDAQLTRFIHLFWYNHATLDHLLASGKFDIVHSWEEPYIFAGYQIARAVRSRQSRLCFRTAQSYVKTYPPPFGFFERQVLKQAQGWIAGASLVYQAMLQRQYPRHKGHILNLAVDLDAFTVPSRYDREKVVSELGLTAPIVGFVGRLTKDKGVRVLIEAMDLIRHRDWSLLFLGSGECKSQIEEWAAGRGLSARVKVLLAKHDEVPRYLGAMDILAAPSQTAKNWREQFGRMIVEAFGCGVAVIGSDSGEIPNVIGDAGLVISESDAAAWAEAISGLLANPAERANFARLGLERVKHFSVSCSAERYKKYYRWLAEQPII